MTEHSAGPPLDMDAGQLAKLLMVADSAFPTGAFGFSWGLERLARDDVIGRQQLAGFLRAHLIGRWAPFDRFFIAAAHTAHGDLERLKELDLEVEAMTWAEAARHGSRTAGAGLLAAHRNVSTPGLDAYAAALETGAALGHLPVVEGLVYGAGGLQREAALTVSGMGFVSRLLSAAVRLNLVGAISAQRITADLSSEVASLAHAPLPDRAAAFSPLADIALMRHDRGRGTLFSN